MRADVLRRRARYWTEGEAYRRLSDWNESGLSLAEYARQKRVPQRRLEWWKRKLTRAGSWSPGAEIVRSAGAPVPCGEGSPARAPHFIEIALKSAMDSPSMEPSGLELVVRDDYRVRIPVGFDANTLKRVLAVLEEAV